MMNNEFGLSGYELELAKRGGVVKVINLYSPVHEVFYAKLVEPLGGWGYFAKCHGNRISTKDVLLFEAAYCTNDRETLEGYNVLGMATPKECEEAGVEYIEPLVDPAPLKKRIDEFEDAIRNLHKALGSYPTQKALESLFKLVGLENNIGEKNE